jgi:ribose transport system substrate-binding protein
MPSRRDALVTLLLAPLAASGAACGKPADKALDIAVIPKGTTHEFWKSVHAGAVKAAQEVGHVNLIWKGPLKEDDLKSQVDIVQSFVAQGVAGIILAPLNDKALVNPVKAAADARIPVVIIDSDLQGSDYVSFIATDNRAAGAQAGEAMARLLGGAGKVVMLRYQEGSASTTARETGFLEAVRKGGLTVVSDNQYGGATTESAFAAAESLLAAQKAGEGGVNGVFAPNESTAFGVLLALRKAGLAGKIAFVGFDASEKLLQGLRDGHIDALVVQDPFRMGEGAVRAIVGAIRGQKPEAVVRPPARLVSKADLDAPEVKALVHPDLARWLGE